MATSSMKLEKPQPTAYGVLLIMGFCHLLNDSLQAVVPAMFPILEQSMNLSYTQLGMIAFSLNIVASILQPGVGWYTDKKPQPYALPIGLTSTFIGILLLGLARSYGSIIFSVILIGLGSAIFHPEGSRVAYMAGGKKRGLAQSIYQVGGNTGQALAPLISALIFLPYGQRGALMFVPVALCAVLMLLYIARWYQSKLVFFPLPKKRMDLPLSQNTWNVAVALSLILFIIFARSWYISCMTNFYAFYLIEDFSLTTRSAQIFIFAFLAAGALGTLCGGPFSDRYGKKNVILFSLAASAPLTIILPLVSPTASFILLLISGFIIMTSFSVTVIYAQTLVPGKVGTMAGLTVGLAFGMGAIGSVAFGSLADVIGIAKTVKIAGFLPLLGVISLFLPSDSRLIEWNTAK